MTTQIPTIIHHLRIIHKDLYCIGLKLPKRDKLGLHKTIEDLCLKMLSLSIEAAFQTKINKRNTLGKLRIKNSVLQNLIRTETELKIIDDKTYQQLSEQAVEISKENNNWINSLT